MNRPSLRCSKFVKRALATSALPVPDSRLDQDCQISPAPGAKMVR